MPQMAPLNWLTLLFFFISIFIIFNIMNFYNYNNYPPKSFDSKKKNLSINWQW
uniref:ATP synthase complex subunit 8 n=1 Tax=Cobelura sp. KM-2017 TaxID=2219490 RepID=A0A346RIX6_9CUCU|nr:ATP synthase F0 subunit 8 [Cobelura sp. KM-2017]